MSCSDLSRRAALALALGGFAAGCGFEPVYREGGAAAALLDDVAIGQADGRLGFNFRRGFERRHGRARADARYLLNVTIATVEASRATSRTNSVTRFDVTATATYALIDTVDGVAALSGAVSETSAYNTTSSVFATRTAERDAQDRLAEVLAERVAARISAAAPDLASR